MQVDISKIDSNFLAGSKITRQDIVWYPIWEAPIRIYGLAHTEPEKFWRLPESLMGEISEGLGYWAGLPPAAVSASVPIVPLSPSGPVPYIPYP